MPRLDSDPDNVGPDPFPKAAVNGETVRQALGFAAYIRPFRTLFFVGMTALVLAALLGLVFPMMAGSLIDAALNPAGATIPWIGRLSLNHLALLLACSVALQVVASFTSSLAFNRVGQSVLADIRGDCYRRVVSMPMAFFGRRRVGELTNRISVDVGQMEGALIEVLPQICRQSIFLVGGILLIALTSVKLTAAILGTIALLMVVGLYFGRRLRQSSRKTQDELASSNTIVEETLHAIASVKAFANEAFEIGRYEVSNARVLRAAFSAARWRALLVAFFVSALFGGVILMLWYGARLLQQGDISIGQLTRFVLYSIFIAGAMGHTAELFSQIQKTIGASQRLRELLREPVEDEVEPTQWIRNFPMPSRLRGDVRFESVEFSYPSRVDFPVLRGLNLRARAGERIALVGPSGAGKSTLMALLLRFYDPESGRVVIDGRDARDYPMHWLRGQMAIVPQEVLLFGGTIAENIVYGRPGADMAAVAEAAKLANADDFIRGFPEGYSTVVGDRGVKLSGGQRQRIAIARAILKDPAILILDEATNSLDSESEQQVQIALERLMKGRTSFIIAHRLATVRNASSIAVIDAGRVVERGTHEELFSREKGRYRRLSNLQFPEAEIFTAA